MEDMAVENTSRAFWIQEPGQGRILEGAVPPLSRGQVRVRTLYSGISRGTESLVFHGRVPPSQRDAMRCPFQEGQFPAPVKYGYMNVGVVEAGEGIHAEDLVGREVFSLYPHQERFVVPASAVTPIPDGVPAARAVLAANMETAVNGVWDGAPSVGDRVVVVGGGVVGMLVAWLASRIPGVDLTLVDPNPARESPARALGVSWSATLPAGVEADLVFHASGTPEGARDALTAAGTSATVVELSWFGDQAVPLPLGENFHPLRLRLISSQVGRIPPQQAPRWTHRRRTALALSLLADPALDVLITVCHRIRYGG